MGMLQVKGVKIALVTAATVVGLACLSHRSKGVAAQAARPQQSQKDVDWPTYNGQSTGDHYSALTQINRKNVNGLKQAWVFDTGEEGGLQTNPLMIGRTLFAFSPTQKVFALDAASGKKLWTFDNGTPGLQPARGFAYWTDGKTSILFAGMLSSIYALDPASGKLVKSFGEDGRLDLRKGIAMGDPTQSFAAPTSPGLIYKDMIIVGFRLPETKPALHGDIQAFDVHTGKLRWTFHTIPHPGEPGYESWPKDAWKVTGAANNWCGMVLDEPRGIVYIPTGSAVDDFYGADRLGNNLYADTLLALDANTGKRLWHFQGVHHDLWDRDFPSPPALVTVKSNGKVVDAVAQTTKQGMVFLFDRVTGKPLFPIEERPFPPSDVPGEEASPTQPIATLPAPYARQLLTEDMLTNRTPEAHAVVLKQFKAIRSEGQFVPLSVNRQTIIFPGLDGGAEWGGPAVDTKSGIIYINSNEMPWIGDLSENKAGGQGFMIYQGQCSMCHAGDRKGSPPSVPSLIDVQNHLSDAQIGDIVRGGKGRMPSFPHVDGEHLTALLEYLKTGKEGGAGAARIAVKYGDRSEVAGARVYDHNCAICHGEDLLGAPSNYPGLMGVRDRLSDIQILENIHRGKGRMPSFSRLTDADTTALLRFLGQSKVSLLDAAAKDDQSSKHEMENAPASATEQSKYRFNGYKKFRDPDGYPAVAPPWGTLNAIDLNTGKYLWKIPFGEFPELVSKGMKDTGSENYGGPIVTAGGLVIIGATIFDRKIRAFNSTTGELLWSALLPYSGNATPATYMIDGRQYVVIAASGARDSKGPQGAAYVAFALP